MSYRTADLPRKEVTMLTGTVTFDACPLILREFAEMFPTMSYAMEMGAFSGLDLCEDLLRRIDDAAEDEIAWIDAETEDYYSVRDAWKDGTLWYRIDYR